MLSCVASSSCALTIPVVLLLMTLLKDSNRPPDIDCQSMHDKALVNASIGIRPDAIDGDRHCRNIDTLITIWSENIGT